MSPQPVHLIPGKSFHGLVQIAGVHDMEEATMLADVGVHAIGFPLRLPVNTEDCTEAEAASMATSLQHRITPVCICYLEHAAAIIDLSTKLNMQHVQLHGPVAAGELAQLKSMAPHLFVIKSLVVRENDGNLQELEQTVAALAPFVDAFITDTHNPETGADGATGKTHDWSVSRRLVELSPRPVILAGGLTPENVAEAIRLVRPAGVDAHTGMEGADGRKDRNLTLRFFTVAYQEFIKISAITA